jgi:putative transposase
MSSYYNQYSYYPIELKQAVAVTGDINLFPELNIPKSTTRDWAKKAPPDIVSPQTLSIIESANLKKKILKKDELITQLQEKIELIARVYSDMGLVPKNTKIRDIETKKKVLKSINDLQKTLTTKQVLNAISFSKSRLTRWTNEIKTENNLGAKEYEQNHPLALSEKEFTAMKVLYTNPDYAHYPTCALHYLAKREDLIHCSVNTWYKYSKIYNLARPFKRYNLKEYKEGIRANCTNEIWHIDITEIKLNTGQKYYLQVVIDNFSRYCIAWQLNKTKEAYNTVELLRSAKNNKKKYTNLMMDKGSENINVKVNKALNDHKITRVIAKLDTEYSNSMIEAFFRSLKNNYLYFQNPNTLKELTHNVEFYINEHNFKIPHSAHNGLTPEEVYKNKPTMRFYKNLKKKTKESIQVRQEVFYDIAS